jgi:predicted secreted Zn-dependent protease
MEEWKGELLLVKSHHVRVATLCIIFCFVKKKEEEYAALFYNVSYFVISGKGEAKLGGKFEIT